MFINQDFILQQAALWLRLLRMLEKKINSDQVEALIYIYRVYSKV